MRIVVVALGLLASLAHAQTRILPTDADLKSAYCLRIKQHQGTLVNDIASNEPQSSPAYEIIQKMARDHNADVNRLQSYLVPRISSLEATGLLAAANRGDSDIKELESMTAVCVPKCRQFTEPVMHSEKWRACQENCAADYPAATRVYSCKTINWLPF